MPRIVRGTLAACLCAVTLLSTPAPAGASAGPAWTAASVSVAFEWAIDVERTSRGLPPLVPDPTISAEAQVWSGAMALFGTLVHDRNFSAEVAAADASWRAAGENVGYGASPSSVEAAFMASPAHRANILGNYTHMGVGVFIDGYGRVWVTERFYG
jgi:uncharacterized protein YkwD